MQAALNDFEYFLEKCPEDPTALLLLPQLEDLQLEIESIH